MMCALWKQICIYIVLKTPKMSSGVFALEVELNVADQQISRSWVGDTQINQRNSMGNLSSMNMNRLREPGHAQFLLILFVVLQFFFFLLKFCFVLFRRKSDSRVFFPPIVNMKSYPHVLPEEWMKTTKEARIVSWGKTHCNLLLLCTTCIMYVCACPHRIHCSRSAPSRPCPSCIRSDTLHHGWNPTLEEKHGEVMSSKKGQYITPQDYQSLWVHFYFLISPESDEGRSSP